MTRYFLFCVVLVVGACAPESSDDADAGAAAPSDSGTAADAGADAGAADAGGGAGRDGGACDAGRADGGNSGGSGIDLGDGCPLPPGRTKCYFGSNYQCNAEGQECCEENQRCYFPASEPDYCD